MSKQNAQNHEKNPSAEKNKLAWNAQPNVVNL